VSGDLVDPASRTISSDTSRSAVTTLSDAGGADLLGDLGDTYPRPRLGGGLEHHGAPGEERRDLGG
jgi:hypothetical protein